MKSESRLASIARVSATIFRRLPLQTWSMIFGVVCALGVATGAFAQLPKGRLITFVLHGRGLERTSTGDSPDRKVEVYLPPMYGICRCKFPVIYLLHGYKGSADQWTSDPDWNIQGEMDKAIAGGLKPLIIVMPDAKTRAGGSFYVNSSADGQWEDFIVKELVGAIDQRFDTLAMPEARAIAGHSMGGYGALYIAFRHPDVFSAIYALSPCCLEIAGDLLPSNPEWFVSERFLSFDVFKQEDHYVAQAFEGMAIAWSPQAGEKPFGASLPVRLQGTKQVFDPSIRALWNAHMIVPTVSAEIANVRRLRAVGFDAGRQDPFTHIPLGESDLDHILHNLNVAHQFELYDGDHNSGVPKRITTKMLPFLAGVLTTSAIPSQPTTTH